MCNGFSIHPKMTNFAVRGFVNFDPGQRHGLNMAQPTLALKLQVLKNNNQGTTTPAPRVVALYMLGSSHSFPLVITAVIVGY
jgi:hypothetical protein